MAKTDEEKPTEKKAESRPEKDNSSSLKMKVEEIKSEQEEAPEADDRPSYKVKIANQAISEAEAAEAVEKKPEAENEPNSETSEEEKASENNSEESESDIFIDEPSGGKGSPKKILLIVALVALVVALVAGGILVYQKAIKKQAEPSETIGEQLVPPPTEEAEEVEEVKELDRSELKIQILNGSGIAGEAGRAKDLLEGLGYADIEVANADSYDYEETEIALKEGSLDYFSLLSEDLSEDYMVASESDALEEDNEYDAVITLGSGKTEPTDEETGSEEAGSEEEEATDEAEPEE